MSIETPDPRMGEALERAKLQLGDALDHVSKVVTAGVVSPHYRDTARSDDLAWIALAALCAGDHDAAAEIAASLEHRPDPASDERASRRPADAMLLDLLLAARCLAWTGDHAFLIHQWPSIEQALASVSSSRTECASPGLRAAALHEMRAAAESIGRTASVTRLTTVEASPRATPESTGDPAIELLIGRPSPRFVDGWLGAVAAPGAPVDPISAARFIAPLVHGILGVEPDAPRHRLALRPWLPERWSTVRVANLRLGDAAVDIRYARQGAHHDFELEQTAGAVPIRLIFEPALAISTLREAAVDGVPARLDTRPLHDRVVAPVQVMLDHARTIRFDG